MSGNSFGRNFVVTTFGESHGRALGCIVDGCPPGMPLTEADIQVDLDRRRPGQSRHTTARKEPDQVQILSGVFEGVTTGTPIGLLIEISVQIDHGVEILREMGRPLAQLPVGFLALEICRAGPAGWKELELHHAAGEVPFIIDHEAIHEPVLDGQIPPDRIAEVAGGAR